MAFPRRAGAWLALTVMLTAAGAAVAPAVGLPDVCEEGVEVPVMGCMTIPPWPADRVVSVVSSEGA